MSKRLEKTFLEEFQEFILRGNVIELAVGLTVGAGFTSVVNSLVDNILLPPIGMLMQGSSFDSLFVSLDGKVYKSLEEAEKLNAPILKYGAFVADFIDFLIIAFAVFVLVKVISKVHKNQSEKDKAKDKSIQK